MVFIPPVYGPSKDGIDAVNRRKNRAERAFDDGWREHRRSKKVLALADEWYDEIEPHLSKRGAREYGRQEGRLERAVEDMERRQPKIASPSPALDGFRERMRFESKAMERLRADVCEERENFQRDMDQWERRMAARFRETVLDAPFPSPPPPPYREKALSDLSRGSRSRGGDRYDDHESKIGFDDRMSLGGRSSRSGRSGRSGRSRRSGDWYADEFWDW